MMVVTEKAFFSGASFHFTLPLYPTVLCIKIASSFSPSPLNERSFSIVFPLISIYYFRLGGEVDIYNLYTFYNIPDMWEVLGLLASKKKEEQVSISLWRSGWRLGIVKCT